MMLVQVDRIAVVFCVIWLCADASKALGQETAVEIVNKAQAVERASKEGCLLMRVRLKDVDDVGKNKALTHPFVVDAAKMFSTYVVPGEKDALQFSSASGDVLTQEITLTSDAALVLKQMRDALIAGKKTSPGYLDLVVFENTPNAREKATVYVWCYDPGESMLGGLNGVLRSQGGILKPSETQLAKLDEQTRKKLGYKEVVEIEYDPTLLDYSTILNTASKLRCMGASVARTDEQVKASNSVLGRGRTFRSDQPLDRLAHKRHLGWHKQGLYQFVPMTELQMTKLNHAVWAKETKSDQEYIDSLLFPCQVALRNEAERLRNLDAKIKLQKTSPADRDLNGIAANIAKLRESLQQANAELGKGTQ